MIFTETDEQILKMPSRLNITPKSYETLANIQHNVLESDSSKILLNFTETNYIDAIYMAFIGGLKVLSQKKYGKQVVYRLHKNTKLYRYFKNSGLYEYFKKGTSYINKNAIPFSEIHMEEDSMVESHL